MLKMKNVFFACIASMFFSTLVSVNAGAATQYEYFVDPLNGNDTNDGTSITTAFASIEKAKETVQEVNDNMTGDIVVNLRGGVYHLDETIEFDENDSGSNGYSIIYQAYEDEKPVISGGKEITGWEIYDSDKQIYKLVVGEPIETRQLYIDGVRAVRARSTGEGLSNATTNDSGHTTTDTFLSAWKNVSDIEMVYKQSWTNSRCGVETITSDGTVATITMKQPGFSYLSSDILGETKAAAPWYYENAYELIDSEGEWYLDRTGAVGGTAYTFYYKPLSGQDMTQVETVVPTLEKLIDIQGTENTSKAENIEFKGIQFSYTTWLRPNSNSGYVECQNAIMREAKNKEFVESDKYNDFSMAPYSSGVFMKNVDNISFERCEFSRLGGIGIGSQSGIHNVEIIGNRFFDISANAVQLGDVTGYNNPESENYCLADTPDRLINNVIENNYIYNIGCEYRGSAAIGVVFSEGTQITHNEIYDIPYSGIHIGWGWSNIDESYSNNNNISYNHIHKLMQTQIDGGGIYTLGRQNRQGESLITNNYIQDQENEYGAMYFDQYSSNYTASNNVVDTVKRWLTLQQIANGLENITVSDSYTNTDVASLIDKETVVVSNTNVIKGNSWPSKAVDVMQNAGLEEDYLDIKENIELTKQPDITMGDTSTIYVGPKDDGYEETGVFYDSRTAGYQNTETRYNMGPNGSAKWNVEISEPGSYGVYVWVVKPVSGEATKAKVEVKHKDGVFKGEVDLTTEGFAKIGDFEFEANDDAYVKMTQSDPGVFRTSYVKFDASGDEETAISFTDVSDDYWAKKEINELAARGIVNGDNGIFNPDSYITRAEFLTMVGRTFEYNGEFYNGEFCDVKSDDWFAPIVAAFSKSGVVEGDNGMFYPLNNVTNEEAVKILVESYEKFKGSSVTVDENQGFEYYENVSDWARPYIDKGFELGVSVGFEQENKFSGDIKLTRAQASVMIYNIVMGLEETAMDK